ncbi:MAG: DUF3047 domain-containing protein [Nitrospiraceae bacterium]|nr:MAG: DUF3047 domain-containing protein [Nitrospiraceae bacterium]
MNIFKNICIVLTRIRPCLLLSIFAVPAVLHAGSDTVSFRDDFRSLENWRPTYFTKIKEHTEYSIETEGEQNFLKAESSASASGIVLKREFSLPEYTKVRWRWKISNVYKKGNGEGKAGDDYPMRVYIAFKYDPSAASITRRLKYGLIRSIYGEYPPHSSLVYIWANHMHRDRIIDNVYASEAKMVVLQAGNENSGKWVDQEINIVEDYQDAFGTAPPATWGIALMNDSDNTGESSVSYIDYIEVFR